MTTSLQSFGLIITAEPYFSVSTPSDVVVMQNVILQDKTAGVIEPVIAHYHLLPRGAYTITAGAHTNVDPITRDEHSPLELYEAHNAVRLAELAGAAQYSPDTLAAAKTAMLNADEMDKDKHRDEKVEITYAREAVQRAEDARIDTLRKQAAERANAGGRQEPGTGRRSHCTAAGCRCSTAGCRCCQPPRPRLMLIALLRKPLLLPPRTRLQRQPPMQAGSGHRCPREAARAVERRFADHGECPRPDREHVGCAL